MSDPTPTPETLIAQWRAESKKLLATKETSQNVQFFQEAHGAGFRLTSAPINWKPPSSPPRQP